MLAPPHKRNETRYCKFHWDHGHDIEDCKQLKKKIERHIKRENLSKFVKTNEDKEKEVEYRQQLPHRSGVINVIVGGITVRKDSNSVRKNYAQSSGSTSVDKNEWFS
ncbi:Uncharacterized protein Adt_33141 [Abeliophyllum distichum]|uniref:Retrotransposon gag domain-containing protein n=1 Tax=Abeliophyllum distichum TaxID=126358 RepID=A0ABD1QVE2_9LAMI